MTARNILLIAFLLLFALNPLAWWGTLMVASCSMYGTKACGWDFIIANSH